MSPRTSFIVQIIFFFRSFVEISKNIQSIKRVRLEPSSEQYFNYLTRLGTCL